MYIYIYIYITMLSSKRRINKFTQVTTLNFPFFNFYGPFCKMRININDVICVFSHQNLTDYQENFIFNDIGVILALRYFSIEHYLLRYCWKCRLIF